MTTRIQVEAAFRPLVDAGYSDPAAIPKDDPISTASRVLYFAWSLEQYTAALTSGDTEARIRATAEAAMLLVDVGFRSVLFLSRTTRQLWGYMEEARASGLEELQTEIREDYSRVQSLLCDLVTPM